MLFEFIDKLRKKPKETKEFIAFGFSIAVTAVVAIGWLVTYIPNAGASLSNGSIGNMFKPFSKIPESISENLPQDAGPQMATPAEAEIFNGTSTEATTTDQGVRSTTTVNSDVNTGLNE